MQVKFDELRRAERKDKSAVQNPNSKVSFRVVSVESLKKAVK